jgi:hypothetical protein
MTMEFTNNLPQGSPLNKMRYPEEKKRTVMEMSRSMLKEKHLSNEYWFEVVACATYIMNICFKF